MLKLAILSMKRLKSSSSIVKIDRNCMASVQTLQIRMHLILLLSISVMPLTVSSNFLAAKIYMIH